MKFKIYLKRAYFLACILKHETAMLLYNENQWPLR